MWWEGDDFHIVDMHDQHQVFKNASIVGYSNENVDDANIIETEIITDVN